MSMTAELRTELKQRIDAASRVRAERERRLHPERRKQAIKPIGPICPATLGMFAVNPGGPCGRPAGPSGYCGVHKANWARQDVLREEVTDVQDDR